MYKKIFYFFLFLSSATLCAVEQQEQPVEAIRPELQSLVALVKGVFIRQRSEQNSVVVGGENFNLATLWCEESWTTKAACVKSAYKYLAQQNEPPTQENMKEIFSSCFRFFEEDNKINALVYNVYSLGCIVLKYAKEDSLQFQFAKRAVLNAAQLLPQQKNDPSFFAVCADMVPYWGALCMACLSGITLRRPVIHTMMSAFGIKKDPGFKVDLLFSAATATLFVACGLYAGYLQARNRMLSYKNEAYEQNSEQHPDANTWEMSHTEQESFGEHEVTGAQK